MRYQLRLYTIRAGEMETWLREWEAQIRPLRQSLGFRVVGSWRAADLFVWILHYEGPLTFEEADAAYYASPARKAMHPDPAQYIESAETFLMESVPPSG